MVTVKIRSRGIQTLRNMSNVPALLLNQDEDQTDHILEP